MMWPSLYWRPLSVRIPIDSSWIVVPWHCRNVGPVHVDADCGYGRLMTEDMKTIDGLTLVGLSQEHGKVVEPSAHQFQSWRPAAGGAQPQLFDDGLF